MSAPDLSDEIMSQLKESGAEKHVTLLLGAGASTTSGLPGWDELTVRLLMGSGIVPNEETANLLLKRQDPLIVVEAARAMHPDDWVRKVRSALYRGVVSTEFSPLHLAAVSHLLGGDRGDTSLLTLNFDTLLEEAIERETGEDVLSVSDSADSGELFTVHHLHGVVSPTGTKDVILALTDFLEVVNTADSWQLEYLRSAVTRGAVIIAGTSYRDPDVRQWLHAARQHSPADHAVLVLLARQGFDVSSAEFANLKDALFKQWEAVGLRAVLLDDHSDAAQVIRELRHVNDPSYMAPQERAAMIWKHHCEHFEALQSEYVEALRLDSTEMRSMLDVDLLNMTIWLSNGKKELVRWAAEDRIYLDLDSLRAVQTGYDSSWIAGQALGADTLLIKDVEPSGTRRWKSVLAIPIPAPHPHLPTMTAAVLTIGLPGRANQYEDSKVLWLGLLSEIADSWSTRITHAVFEDNRASI
ncbi:SIR2 family protein [Okibacterium fritillariae]|uniref:SIR2-like domain-containing protein n=1 Tax=Okibacterium fritillariae TaxID=123320 RepID=A0A1T5L0G7_9MICO|nr:SIR2 family protein [Okibacterium fritillariae]SKC69129.1 SIR2-like domain-containing protein [Okibacterium fritillariae]